VGPRDALAVSMISGIRPTWTGQPPGTELAGEVQVRAHGLAMPANVRVHADGLQVVLESATSGVAPGQAVVLYEGSRVIGSATISATQA
jgi:tRNA-uridine 2-sulfurtransferase